MSESYAMRVVSIATLPFSGSKGSGYSVYRANVSLKTLYAMTPQGIAGASGMRGVPFTL